MAERLSGLIVKEQSGFYWVEAEDSVTYMCELRGRLKEEAKASDIAAIGDRAVISLRREAGADVMMGVIEELAPRKSVLSRAVAHHRQAGRRASRARASRHRQCRSGAFCVLSGPASAGLENARPTPGRGRTVGISQNCSLC